MGEGESLVAHELQDVLKVLHDNTGVAFTCFLCLLWLIDTIRGDK